MRAPLIAIVAVLASAGCSDRRPASAPARVPADPWTTVGIGSVFETKTITRMERPFAHQSETATKQTLIARTASDVSVKLELLSERGVSAQDVTIPLHEAPPEPCVGSSVTIAEETCTVPAGTFHCTRKTVEVRQGDATHSTVTWTAKDIPVPLKSIVTNENMTTTTELTRIVAAAN